MTRNAAVEQRQICQGLGSLGIARALKIVLVSSSEMKGTQFAARARMVERLRLAVSLVALSTGALISSACVPGGCFSEAGPVVVQPKTECLKLWVGNPEDGTICGSPDLEGTNGCSDVLVLPPAVTGDTTNRVAPGGSVRYAMNRDAAGVRVTDHGDDSQWLIDAMLGEQQLAIAVSIREK